MQTAAILSSLPKPIYHTPTVYEPAKIEMVDLTGLGKDEILKLWAAFDKSQRELRYQHSYSCWCDACEAAFKVAYQPGYEVCTALELAYRGIQQEEYRQIGNDRRAALELMAA